VPENQWVKKKPVSRPETTLVESPLRET
jgi:hypothetical protein